MRHSLRLLLCTGALLAAGPVLRADRHVVVVARAHPDYTQARLGTDGSLRPESYVLMQGNHYPGLTVDRTLERMSFREIAGQLAPELAKRQYLPAASPVGADLLLVVHWGTTTPKVSVQEMTGHVTTDVDHDRLMVETMREFNVPLDLEGNFQGLPDAVQLDYGHERNLEQEFERLDQLTDEFTQQRRRSDSVTLLGYNEELRRLGKRAWTGEIERSLRHDLNTERYFIIVRAYELQRRTAGVLPNRPVWTMHLNISSPGNNFRTALARMGTVAGAFAGQEGGAAETVKVRDRPLTGTVQLGELVILGEAK